jgi:uncharacterized protein (TIGR02118 family)
MIHLVFCLRRLPHLTREQFQRYWLETHAPLVRQHASALGIRRYVQAHAIDHPVAAGAQVSRGAPEPYDGVAELWFDGEALLRSTQTPAGAEAGRALLEDERRFIDLAHSPIFFTEDYEVIA